MSIFQLAQLAQQRVIFGIANRGLGEDIVAVIVIANFLAEAFDFLFDRAHTRHFSVTPLPRKRAMYGGMEGKGKREERTGREDKEPQALACANPHMACRFHYPRVRAG